MNDKKMSGQRTKLLLQTFPERIEQYDTSNLDGNLWRDILKVQPRLAKYCAWDRLSAFDFWDLTISYRNVLNDLTETQQRRAVMLNEHALQYISNPSAETKRLHKVKHEL